MDSNCAPPARTLPGRPAQTCPTVWNLERTSSAMIENIAAGKADFHYFCRRNSTSTTKTKEGSQKSSCVPQRTILSSCRFFPPSSSFFFFFRAHVLGVEIRKDHDCSASFLPFFLSVFFLSFFNNSRAERWGAPSRNVRLENSQVQQVQQVLLKKYCGAVCEQMIKSAKKATTR